MQYLKAAIFIVTSNSSLFLYIANRLWSFCSITVLCLLQIQNFRELKYILFAILAVLYLLYFIGLLYMNETGDTVFNMRHVWIMQTNVLLKEL